MIKNTVKYILISMAVIYASNYQVNKFDVLCKLPTVAINNTNEVDVGGFETLVSDEENNIYIYSSGEMNSMEIDRVMIKIGDNKAIFNWKCIKRSPQISKIKINDKTELLVVILQGSYGTGVNESYIHIVDMNTLEELQCEDFSKVIDSSSIFYCVENNKIVCFATVESSLGNIIGEKKAIYKFEENKFIIDKIYYRDIENEKWQQVTK